MAKKSAKKKRRPTMYDVAELAGVSQTTVSFVVNETPNSSIPQETQERVWDAIRELGYRPNVIARQLYTKRSHIIGFITDHIATTAPHSGKLVLGAQDVARTSGKTLLLTNTGDNPEYIKSAIETMLEHQVDGIIYATMMHKKVGPPGILHETTSVLLNCFDENHEFPSIVPDEVKAGRRATEILLEKGHRRIGFINGTSVEAAEQYWQTGFIDRASLHAVALGREEGYKQALAAYDAPFSDELVCYEKAGPDGGYHATRQLMQLPSPPTALFCFNDQTAWGAYEALRELGLKIPDDVAVMGFDNLELIASFMHPGLSTMELPKYQMGRLVVELLTQAVDGEMEIEPVQHTLECPYIERDSV